MIVSHKSAVSAKLLGIVLPPDVLLLATKLSNDVQKTDNDDDPDETIGAAGTSAGTASAAGTGAGECVKIIQICHYLTLRSQARPESKC